MVLNTLLLTEFDLAIYISTPSDAYPKVSREILIKLYEKWIISNNALQNFYLVSIVFRAYCYRVNLYDTNTESNWSKLKIWFGNIWKKLEIWIIDIQIQFHDKKKKKTKCTKLLDKDWQMITKRWIAITMHQSEIKKVIFWFFVSWFFQ